MTRRLISNTEVLAEMLQDPDFRAEWERTALARAVAEAVIRYRVQRGLSQTALATKAGAEASQLKQTADAGTADLRKALQEEHDRSSRLEQDLTAAQRDVERQTALAVKANAEAARLRQAAESGPAELLKSLQQERDSVARLERDLALARCGSGRHGSSAAGMRARMVCVFLASHALPRLRS